MDSVFLKNAEGTVMEQPAETAGYFMGRDWELTDNPAIAEAEAAAKTAALVAAQVAKNLAAQKAAEKAAAEALAAAEAALASTPETDQNEDVITEGAVVTTGLTKPTK